jgi:hypothetical protein
VTNTLAYLSCARGQFKRFYNVFDQDDEMKMNAKNFIEDLQSITAKAY